MRSVAEILSEDGKQISIVDSRREIWPITGQTLVPPPLNCDVLLGYPRADGISQAIRCLSPSVVICDEVGGDKDIQAIEMGVNAGVTMVTSVHMGSMLEFKMRPQTRRLAATGAFKKVVFLEGRKNPGRIAEIYDIADII